MTARSAIGRLALAPLAVVLVACSSGGGGDDVATLDPSSTSSTTGPGASDEPLSREDALVEFARCVREHGVEMPDPVPGPDGNLILPLDGGYATEPGYPEAEAACDHRFPSVVEPGRSDEERAEDEDEALAYARCMREHGIDLPDPVPGGGGFIAEADRDGRPIDTSSAEFADADDACADARLEPEAVG